MINKKICHYAVTCINSVYQLSETVPNAFEINIISNGNTTEWSPIRSVIIGRMIAQRESDLFITSMITDQIGRHEVLLPINHINYNSRGKKNRKKNSQKILHFEENPNLGVCTLFQTHLFRKHYKL